MSEARSAMSVKDVSDIVEQILGQFLIVGSYPTRSEPAPKPGLMENLADLIRGGPRK
jgi:hypothetical protein